MDAPQHFALGGRGIQPDLGNPPRTSFLPLVRESPGKRLVNRLAALTGSVNALAGLVLSALRKPP